MNVSKAMGAGALVIAICATVATADYDTHEELRPDVRCVDDAGLRFDHASVGLGPNGGTPSGLDPIHCQRLFWDLPATTTLGAVRVAAPFHEDPVPRFPRGVTDRIPPMYVDTSGNGYETDGAGRTALCPEHHVPWWEPVLDDEGNHEEGTDALGYHDVNDPTKPQEGPLYRVACRRGSRAYYGPWQIGRDGASFDALSREQFVRFENTERLNDDVAADMADPTARYEWSMGSEFYNHFASHHGTCYFANNAECNTPGDESKFAPGGTCWEGYQDQAEPDGRCYAADADQGRSRNGDSSESCSGVAGNGAYRNATQIPGRLAVAWGESQNRGIREVEDQIWRCNHHVVHQLPPGSYSMDQKADFRHQTGGIENPRKPGVDCGLDEDVETTSIDETRGCEIFGVGPGEVFGGAVGEMIIQNFTEAAFSGVEPLNLMFNAVVDAATTYYPPFTWQYHTSVWYPPFDAAMIVGAIHSHHRMVKGTMDVLPSNPPRLQSTNEQCGGWAGEEPPDALYVNWEWEDAIVCDWGSDPDGPVVVRKNQGISTTCFVNNGVTPEAIKHGLVAGDLVETVKVLGAPIPEYPETVPASTWGGALQQSPVGVELLYGTHPPVNYRVVYKCSTRAPGSAKLSTLATNSPVCDPNPKLDADDDYVDGAYVNEEQCGPGGICEPGSITFACIGEDEMCIGVAGYYALPRLGGKGHDEAMEELQAGNVDGVGTPGNTGVQMDLPSGDCPECDEGPAL